MINFTKYLTALSAVAALACTAIAQEQTGPRLKCSTEIFDFGFVPQSATVSHTYWVRNSGTETVEIKQIKPNCGCTRVPPTDSTIAPGDSLPVEILFGTKNITGKVEKFTKIVSNAEGRVPALTFRSVVFKEGENPAVISATPSIVNVGSATTGRTTVKNANRSQLTLTVVGSAPDFIRLPISELTLAPEESKELSFEIIPEKSKAEFTKSITLQANDESRTRITIPVTNVKKE